MAGVISNPVTGVKMGLGKLPGREQECFYFEEGNVIYPFAFIRNKNLEEAKRLWDLLLTGIPSKEEVIGTNRANS